MYPRRIILHNRSYSHVFFRCHNREHFFRPFEIKKALLNLWSKYKGRYGVRIYEFNIMDNHAHLLIRCEDTDQLGAFMRVVNSQIALRINRYFSRDSQAIRERYKSPLISNEKYFLSTIKYIWINRFRIGGVPPEFDPFCSASWRLDNGVIERTFEPDEKLIQSLNGLLDSYGSTPLGNLGSLKNFLKKLLEEAKSEFTSLRGPVFTHSHTIGDTSAVAFRVELLNAFQRQQGP